MSAVSLTSWELFVLRHRKPGNLAVHFVSFVVYYTSPCLALGLKNPLYLLGLPLSGMIGASGHFLFKDGGVKVKEATFDPKVVMFVTLMFYKIAKGTYARDIQAAQTKAGLQS